MKTYVAQCACGWTSTPKPTIGKANLAGAAHVRFAPQYRFGHGISVEVKK